uniref:Uncharacterized protein n=1 Tax=Aegilops tauschii subsp. strangulata TaxID=200361 RepID=A0A453IX61_AEGTS
RQLSAEAEAAVKPVEEDSTIAGDVEGAATGRPVADRSRGVSGGRGRARERRGGRRPRVHHHLPR